MSIEILVNVAPRETRAAILDNGVVQEIHVERTGRRGLVSNLYKGRVSRVLPGMQAAFVEIGLERTAFLHAADIVRAGAEDTIAAYVASGAPFDKAGGYAIQGRGALFIEYLSGSFSGVMGLPLYETGELLSAAGIAL